MRPGRWLLLLVLLAGPGCLLNPFQTGGKEGSRASLPQVPPAAVSADQINLKNARVQADALDKEIEYEFLELHTKETKTLDH